MVRAGGIWGRREGEAMVEITGDARETVYILR